MDILGITKADALKGLADDEARARLAQYGFNELPREKRRSILHLIWEVVQEPMFLLLLATASIYIVLGDFRDSLSLMGAVLLIIGITIYQKRKTENAIQALRDLSSPQALVLREGKLLRISGRDVVPGDIVYIKEGDRIPADALLVANLNLTVDESILTGESMPVTKSVWEGEEDVLQARPGSDEMQLVYSGTLAVGGSGHVLVHATGANTQIGHIGKSLQSISHEDTLLSKEIRRIVRLFTVLGAGTCILLVLIYGFYYGAWLKGVLAGLTLSISLIPEEFPVVLTLFLTLGAWRIARLKVLTRRPDVIETLGAATVLCSDKTGTITMNKMQVQKLYAEGNAINVDNTIPYTFHEVLKYGLLASRRNPFDPMEKAIHETAGGLATQTDHWTLIREYPLFPGLMSMTEVWDTHSGGPFIVAAKGAPEAIFSLCRLTVTEIDSLEQEVHRMAAEGLRILGVAKASFSGTDLPGNQSGFDFQFCGLIGFADPVRPMVAQSLQECYSAGIRVIMITGDYPATAKNIAGRIGMHNPERVLTGEQLDKLSDEKLREVIRETNVFSRIVPHQKLRLVNALKAQGEIVAMTGDGVNDAPALKSAHIGIAMGQKGTDVAREASDIVLLNDDFTSIVAATRMGRRIFDNLQKAISYIIAIHVPIAGLALIPVFGAGLPVILFPIHIAFFELLTDPMLSIAFEAEKEERNSMNRPPRKLDKPLVSRRRLFLSLLQGFFVLGAVLAVYFYLISSGRPADDVRTVTFATVIAANLGLALTNRSWTRAIFSRDNQSNKTLFYMMAGGAVLIVLVFYVPAVRSIFHFTELHPVDLLISSAMGFASVLWFELYKVFRRK